MFSLIQSISPWESCNGTSSQMQLISHQIKCKCIRVTGFGFVSDPFWNTDEIASVKKKWEYFRWGENVGNYISFHFDKAVDRSTPNSVPFKLIFLSLQFLPFPFESSTKKKIHFHFESFFVKRKIGWFSLMSASNGLFIQAYPYELEIFFFFFVRNSLMTITIKYTYILNVACRTIIRCILFTFLLALGEFEWMSTYQFKISGYCLLCESCFVLRTLRIVSNCNWISNALRIQQRNR